VTKVVQPSIPSVLRERASLQPSEKAFTFIDYEQDWDGVPETITWSQLHRRSLNVAQAVRSHGSAGDRAVIVAPQGLNYIDAFFGALQAGLIAVPLSVPLGGASDERVSSVLQDASPSVVLTTSAVSGVVAEYLEAQQDGPAPAIVEIDSLDLDARSRTRLGSDTLSDTAYLQYTSGSTRAPAGVEITYRNLLANFEQIMSAYFSEYGKVAPPDTTFVSWLPFYHDMGLLGHLHAGTGGPACSAHQSGVVSREAGAVAATSGKQYPRLHRRAELCVRGGGAKDFGRGDGGLRSWQCPRHPQRQ
jgi:fatty acid CoA ligase FadD28